MSGELNGWKVAVLGGDRRMLEIMRQAKMAGAAVRACGGPPGAEQATGQPQAATVAEAVEDADLICCPVPGLGPDDSLYSPYSRARLHITADALRRTRPHALVMMGRVSPGIQKEGDAAGRRAIGFGDDDALAVMHAVPTAEGALRVAIEHTETTILECPTLCIGLGRVGMSVAQTFAAAQADVTLAARNPSQLARAWAMGLNTVHLKELPDVLDRFDLIVSSASGMVLTRDLLPRVRPDALVIDLCSPPGSVDFKASEELGRKLMVIGTLEKPADFEGPKVIWARGQAGTAPRTSGYNEWQVIMRIVGEELIPKLR